MASRATRSLTLLLLIAALNACGGDDASNTGSGATGGDSGEGATGGDSGEGGTGGDSGEGGSGGDSGEGGAGGDSGQGGAGGDDEDSGVAGTGGDNVDAGVDAAMAIECDEGAQDNDGDGLCSAACTDVTCVHGTCDDASGAVVCDCEPLYEGSALCDELAPPPQTGLVMWLDASQTDTLTLASGKLVRWTNAADGNSFFEQVTASAQPTLTERGLNNRPTMRFDGNDFMRMSDFAGLTGEMNYRVFVVMTSHNDTESGVVLAGINAEEGTAGVGQHGLLLSTNATADGLRLLHRMPFSGSGGLDLLTTDPVALGGASVIRFGVDATGLNATASIVVNGTIEAIGSDEAVVFNRDLDLSLGRLSPTSDSRYLEGDVSEILIYATTQNVATNNAVTAYLRAHWGLLQ